MPCHTGSHGEAADLIMRKKEQGGNCSLDIFVVFSEKDTAGQCWETA